MTCKSCGHVCNADAHHCPKCHAHLVDTQRADSPEELFNDKTDPRGLSAPQRLGQAMGYAFALTTGALLGLGLARWPSCAYAAVPLAALRVVAGLGRKPAPGVPRAISTFSEQVMSAVERVRPRTLALLIATLAGIGVQTAWRPLADTTQADAEAQNRLHASTDFAQELPGLRTELAAAYRLVTQHNLNAAEQHLKNLTQAMATLQRHRGAPPPEVVAMNKQISVVRDLLESARREQAEAQNSHANRALLQQVSTIDNLMARGQWTAATNAWAKAQQSIAKMSPAALQQCPDLGAIRTRLAQQQESLRGAVAERSRGRRSRVYSAFP